MTPCLLLFGASSHPYIPFWFFDLLSWKALTTWKVLKCNQCAMHTRLSRSFSPRKSTTNLCLAEPSLSNGAGSARLWRRKNEGAISRPHDAAHAHKETPLKLLDCWVSSKWRRSVYLSGRAPWSAVVTCDIKEMIAWYLCTPLANLELFSEKISTSMVPVRK